MRKIAVLGSRDWTDLQSVGQMVNSLFGEHGEFILVSGGARGASQCAEATAMQFGIPVISFRPVKLDAVNYDDVYGVDEWRLFRGSGTIVHHNEPTWADYDSAASFRSMLIAERAEFGVAFWDGRSRGTAYEIECFKNVGKELNVVTA